MGSVSRRAAKKKRTTWRKNPVGDWMRSRRVLNTVSVRARPPRTARTHCPLERQPNDIDFVAAGAVPSGSPTGAPRPRQDPPD